MRLHERVAEAIASDIAARSLTTLPGARKLAGRYDVSYTTALKALHALRKRGVIELDHRRRARVRGALPPAAPETLGPLKRTIRTIERQIVDGVYRAGAPLPKVAYFAAELGVSAGTVRKALRLLAGRDLICRRGRAWIAGARTRVEAGTGPAPTILMLLPDENVWRKISRDPREHKRFAQSFAGEAEKHRITTLTAFTQENPDRNLKELLPQGRDGIRAEIKRIGPRYLGVLIPCTLEELPDLRQWTQWLLRFGRPVVWLDRLDEGLPDPIDNRLFFTCRPDSRRGAQLMVEVLAETGHRVIGVPRYASHPYMDPIIKSMEAAAASLPHPVRIAVNREPYLRLNWHEDGDSPGKVVRHLANTGAEPMRSVMQGILKRYPGFPARGGLSVPAQWQEVWRGMHYTTLREFQLVDLTTRLVPLLRDSGATAIVCPGNKNTRFFFWWFDAAGLDIPADVSVISADNSYDFHPYPMSSIDLGYDYLGYAALHLFVGDIPVRVDRNRRVRGKASYFDRGSIGSPRNGSLRVDLRGELL